MTLPQIPPPPPQDGQGLFLPVTQIQGLARLWVQYRPIIQLGARLAKQKIPRELDEVLSAVAGSDERAVQNLQTMAQGQMSQSPYDIQEEELPPSRIGERALTRDLAYLAWRLYHKQGLSLREIALHFTHEMGAPCSHTTIASYIEEIDEEMEEHRGQRLKAVATVILVPAVVGVCMFLAGHFLFR